MQEMSVLLCWVRAKLNQRNEQGFTAVEWLLVALGVIGIAGIAVAAVQAYVTSQTNKLGSP
jgi:type II secretory pathway pseudopilin PulG